MLQRITIKIDAGDAEAAGRAAVRGWGGRVVEVHENKATLVMAPWHAYDVIIEVEQ